MKHHAGVGARRSGWGGALLGIIACSSLLGPERDALEEARARWNVAAPAAYTFEFQRFCFCGTEFLRPVEIQVVDDEVIAAFFAEDGGPVTRALAEIPTIEDLFDEIQNAIDLEAHQVLADYDGELGFPTDVSIDFELQVVDEEMAFRVSGFDAVALPTN